MVGRLDPAVAAVRRAVRRAMTDVGPGRRVLVACSGGADSMALAAATAFEGSKAGWLAGAVVVDHGLQDGSAEVAAQVAGWLRTCEPLRGLEPVEVVRVTVPSSGGPEAAAREARYEALRAAADRLDAVVLLGHTRDDQAETVLLGLARGSGLRSLAGMRAGSGPFRRPLLDVPRAETARVCAALSLPVWSDPHNDDPRFARVRVRRTVLPMLEAELGPGVAEALARTADLADADAEALEGLAGELASAAGLDLGASVGATGTVVHLDVDVLAAAPRALRRRALLIAARVAGCPAGELFARHVLAVDALVTQWSGQAGIDLPGQVTATRRGSTLVLAHTPTPPPPPD